jgi:hypothetical protein
VSSRRGFLKQAAGATVAVAGVTAGAGALARPASAGSIIRKGYVAIIELDGVNVGRLVDASGGDYRFEVVVTSHDSDGDPVKQLGPAHPSSFTIEFGSNMDQAFYDWIAASFTDPTVRKNGAIILADFNYREIARRTFTNAQITSFTTPRILNRPYAFPAMTLTFEAETVSDDTPSGARVDAEQHRDWLITKFSFDCPGLPANKVNQTLSYNWHLASKPQSSTARIINPGNLSLVIDAGGVQAWQQWYDNFAVGGDSSDERAATLSVWGSTHTQPLFRWSFEGLGILSLAPRGGITTPGPNVGMIAEMYVQQASCQCNHL